MAFFKSWWGGEKDAAADKAEASEADQESSKDSKDKDKEKDKDTEVRGAVLI
jgi:hypothetical protein